ncbi:MAG: FGGY family carbohydrate kinase [Planctomycetota bacterium]|nr:FGGY family carbohydrate kinase [Planctomycetota bacterium]
MAESCVIGLDLGTSGLKAVAVDRRGRVVAQAAQPMRTRSTPGDGAHDPARVEQSPAALWRATATALREVAAKARAANVAGLCLSGAMHSLLPVDAAGQPLAWSMTWADGRGGLEAKRLKSLVDPAAIRARTGCPLEAIYHPARLRWWLDEAKPIARRASRFVALRDFVSHALTGQWTTDHSLASTTGLLDIRRLDWDAEALALAGVGAERLPALLPVGGVLGHVTPTAARATGLPAGLPVLAGGSDGALASLGAAGARPGGLVLTVGTSGAVRLALDRPRADATGRTWCYVMAPGHWLAGGAINNGGLAVQWICDRFYAHLTPQRRFAAMFDEAAGVRPGADGLLVLPYLTGERSPWWRPDAQAALAGVTLGHTRAHLARATLEGVAYCLADVRDSLGLRAGPSPSPARLTGGIVHAPTWCQILADVLGMELHASEEADASAMGAVRIAQAALGLTDWASLETPPRRTNVRYRPNPRRNAVYRERLRVFRSMARQMVFEKT